MNEFTIGWLLGFFVCGFLFSLPFTDNYKAQKAKQECEKTLPRNQHCVISAIPEKT